MIAFGVDDSSTETVVRYDRPLDLALACAPVAWAGGRWPNEAWLGGRFVWVGREAGAVVRREVRQHGSAIVVVGGNAIADESWLRRLLAPAALPAYFADPVVAAIATRLDGFATLCYGSLFDGAVVSVVGQSISVAAAAVTTTRLAAMFHPGIRHGDRTLFPLPTRNDLANASAGSVRESGVTGKRAETLVRLGKAFADGDLPDWPVGDRQIAAAAETLLAMPGIGPWTVASALLWGTGHPDAFPVGDAALLRAARRAYGEADMDHRQLMQRAEAWRPARATAARLLWLDLFGPAPTAG